VDAQLVGYVNNTLRFHADATATATTSAASVVYNYGVYLLYNIGYGGYANIPFYSWSITSQNLFSTPKQVTLYSNGGVASTNSKRDLDSLEQQFNISDTGVLNSAHGHELGPAGEVTTLFREVAIEDGIIWSSDLEPSNYSIPTIISYRLTRRQSDGGDAEMQDAGQSPDFSLGTLTCPANQCSSPGGGGDQSLAPCPSTLPDFRCKYSHPKFTSPL
jgi:hypothetical protein